MKTFSYIKSESITLLKPGDLLAFPKGIGIFQKLKICTNTACFIRDHCNHNLLVLSNDTQGCFNICNQYLLLNRNMACLFDLSKSNTIHYLNTYRRYDNEHTHDITTDVIIKAPTPIVWTFYTGGNLFNTITSGETALLYAQYMCDKGRVVLSRKSDITTCPYLNCIERYCNKQVVLDRYTSTFICPYSQDRSGMLGAWACLNTHSIENILKLHDEKEILKFTLIKELII